MNRVKKRSAGGFDLAGNRALVTGGNTGIGLGIARGLARAGAAVTILGRNEKKNRTSLEELCRLHPACAAVSFDLGETKKIAKMFTAVSRENGPFDILVNNAGIQARGRADTIALEDFERVQRINTTAPYALAQSFAREIIGNKRPGGSIIMIASLMSEASRPTTSPYTASKGAIRQLVRALAIDWAPYNIRVNGLGPGYIRTEMTRPLFEDRKFSRWVKGRTPLARWGEPVDFEGAAVFLASEASSFITGQILYIDGGWLATF